MSLFLLFFLLFFAHSKNICYLCSENSTKDKKSIISCFAKNAQKTSLTFSQNTMNNNFGTL